MTTWEENRRAGLAEARATIAESQNARKVDAAFAEWWRDQDQAEGHSAGAPHLRPSTKRLSDQIRLAGMEAAADFSAREWVGEGPIDPGVWLFSTLIGESFVDVFIDALRAGSWRPPSFYGLESFGAWEAFDLLLRTRLRTDANVGAAALGRLRSNVEGIRADPIGGLRYHDDQRGNLEERIKLYSDVPCFDEAWEQPFDPPVWFEDSLLWDVLVEIQPAKVLALLGNMPHPVFMRHCLQRDRLAGRPDEVASLIKAAPPAFDADGTFQADGAVVALLLEIACSGISRTVQDSDGTIHVVPSDQCELLAPTVERCQATIRAILDALFSRRDSVPLAWAWLERLVANVRLRGRFPGNGGHAVNFPMITIISIVEYLQWRDDWKEWLNQREGRLRICRLMAVFAVGMFGPDFSSKRLAGAMEWALMDGTLDYAPGPEAPADSLDVMATIGGRAISMLDDPAGWFSKMWDKLRPIREQNWRVGVGGGKRNNIAELLALWGIAAHGLLAPVARAAFWKSLEKSVRDACQTDVLGYAPFWHGALIRLFGMFRTDGNAESPAAEGQLGQALLPYIEADHTFMTLIVSLVEQGWPVKVIRDAVATAGFDLRFLTAQFMEMKERVFELPQANRAEIQKFRKLAADLELEPR